MLTFLDWSIIVAYLTAMIAMSYFLSLRQKNNKDYYLGGQDMGAWPVALSTMATQCSTSSLLGAPAFVAFSAGGGLVWLQYELALPLAMIALIFFVLPVFRSLQLVSVYGYLEQRFDLRVRLMMSLVFQLIRALATGVTVYGTALVLMSCLGLPFWVAAVSLSAVTILYDMLGGMKAVVYSDVIQMVILVASIVVAIVFSINAVGGLEALIAGIPVTRLQVIEAQKMGFSEGGDFSLLPMIFGGFFLYMAYYGTDQSQVQRELSTRNIDETNKSLMINGFLRFPLVLLYCVLGLCLASYASQFPEFIDALPLAQNGKPNFNMALPEFVLSQFPPGLVGLVMVGLFAASMSSLDSVINSLSAVTMSDFVERFAKKPLTERQQVIGSRLLTLFWGVLCLVFAFFVESISDSIIVAINKIGSLTNGSILAVFLLGLLTRRASGSGVIIGFGAGLAVNVYLWISIPQVSWLWWNVTGFIVSTTVGYLLSLFSTGSSPAATLLWRPGLLQDLGCKLHWGKAALALFFYFLFLVTIGFWFTEVFQ